MNLSIAGEELKATRVRAGLSQEQVAELLHISIRTVGEWERSQVPPHRAPIVRDWIDQYRPGLTSFTSAELVAELERRGYRQTLGAVINHDLADEIERRMATRRDETQPLPTEDEPGWTGHKTSGKLIESPGGEPRSRIIRGRGPSPAANPPAQRPNTPVPDEGGAE